MKECFKKAVQKRRLALEQETGMSVNERNARLDELSRMIGLLDGMTVSEPDEEKDFREELKRFLDESGAPYFWESDEAQLSWCEKIARHFSEWQKRRDDRDVVFWKGIRYGIAQKTDEIGEPVRVTVNRTFLYSLKPYIHERSMDFRMGERIRLYLVKGDVEQPLKNRI